MEKVCDMILYIAGPVDWKGGPVDWRAWETWMGDIALDTVGEVVLLSWAQSLKEKEKNKKWWQTNKQIDK